MKIILLLALFQTYSLCAIEPQASLLFWDINSQSANLDGCPHINSKNKSTTIISAPNTEGSMKDFYIYKTSVMPSELSSKFPSISTYSGIGVNDPSERLSITRGAKKTIAMILSNEGNTFITQMNNEDLFKVSHFEEDANNNIFNSCNPINNNILNRKTDFPNCIGQESPCYLMGNELVTYRLAVIMTESVTNTKADGTVEGGMTWLASMVNQLNLLWLRELSFQLELIANNDILIFTDSNPSPKGEDGFGETNCSNSDPKYCEINNVEPYLDSVIGIGGFDAPDDQRLWEYGMVLNTTYNGGLAQAPGPISASNPDYEVINHELGHNLGSAHNITIEDGYRCSLGGTIMGSRTRTSSSNFGDQYSIHTIEIAFNNFNTLPLDNTYGNSYAYLKGYSRTQTNNVVPSLNVPESGLTIPKETPFVLEGEASPYDSNFLYSWEQNDPSSTSFCMDLTSNADECLGLSSWPSSEGPLFSTVDLSSNGNKRFFPDLKSLLDNKYTTTFDDYGTVLTVERLPFGDRDINMRLQVRTNEINGSSMNFKNVMFSVDGGSGPFRVTSQADSQSWEVESIETITWDVANTNNYPINCSNVDILLSTDGGYNYDIILASNTENDGIHEVNVPLIANAANCRLMVKASNNIFFDINNSFFEILNPKVPSISFENDSITIESSTNNQFISEIIIKNEGEEGSVLAYEVFFIDSTYINEDFENLELSSSSTYEFVTPDNWERSSNGRGWIVGTEESSAWEDWLLSQVSDMYFDIPEWSGENYAFTDDEQYNICPSCTQYCECFSINGCTDGSMDFLILPAMYIPNESNLNLSFDYWFQYNIGNQHNNILQVLVDNSWQTIEILNQSQSQFTNKSYELDTFSGKEIQLRFYSQSDESGEGLGGGWAIDNVVVQTSPKWVSSESYGNLVAGQTAIIPLSINTTDLNLNETYKTKIIVKDIINNISKTATLSLNLNENLDMSLFDNELPKEYILKNPYPNPFNPTTNIDYGLPIYSYVEIKVYDLNGKAVEVLEKKYKNPGNYSIAWDASNHSSGIYFVKLESNGNNISTKKIILLK